MLLHHTLPAILLMSVFVVLVALTACAGETITVERATEEPEQTPLSLPPATDAPTPTRTPRPTIPTPFTEDLEAAALIALFEATDGENWNDNRDWLSAAPVGEWAGITTNSAGKVTELELSDNGLTGSLPPELTDLTELEVLRLHDNQLTGVLSADLANLDSLREVSFWGNQLTWAPSYAPGVLADMVALTALYEDTGGEDWTDNTNWLTTEELGEWFGVSAEAGGRVTGLSLANNELKGEVPPALHNASELTVLHIDNNQLSGELPSQLGRLSKLEQVSIWDSKLTWGDSYGDGVLADTVALVALYESTMTHWDHWRDGWKWATYSPLREWAFVTVEGGRVSQLNIEGRELKGQLPSALGNLTGLKRLNITNVPDLTGELPATLGNLTSLTELTLTQNGLGGELPGELGNLANLEQMNLSNSGFSGEIPAELGNLSNLTVLDFADNILTKIPPEMGQATALKELRLQRNQLTGTVPAELGNLSNLTTLYLDTNKLSGELPAELGGLTNLTNVSVWDNQLTWADHYENGILADTVALVALWESTMTHWDHWRDGWRWATYSPLQEWAFVNVEGGRVSQLNIDGRDLKGQLPSAFGNLVGLKKLSITNVPDLTGELPPTLGSLTDLTELTLTQNGLSGELPAELGNLGSLEHMNLRNNGFSGAIPAELGKLSNLTKLDLSHNTLSKIPPELGSATALKEIYLDHNNLAGTVPAELGNLSNLTLLYLDTNKLSGELPAALGGLSNLTNVSIWDNQLTWADHYENGILADTVALVALWESTMTHWSHWRDGWRWATYSPLREWAFVTVEGGRVSQLNIEGRDLKGQLPSAFGNLRGLRRLNITNVAGLTGELPPSLGNLTDLTELTLTRNGLSGGLPEELGNLGNLEQMNLRHNGFSGEIPVEFGNLSNLTKLDLAHNTLTKIPPELGEATALREIYLKHNNLTGTVPAELGNLSNLTLLYLDTNKLSGELPAALGGLSNLTNVSIWDNQLTWADHYENGILADTVALVALWESTMTHWSHWRDGWRWATYTPLREWAFVTVEGGRVSQLNIEGRDLKGQLPPALANLTGLRKLTLTRMPDLSGCIPASLRGVEYTGDLPFCSGSASKKVTSPQGQSLLG